MNQKIKFMELTRVVQEFFADDLIQRSTTHYFNSTKDRNVRILDIGTGTGLLPFKFENETILNGTDFKLSIDGIDISEDYIQGANSKISNTSSNVSSLKFHIMDGQDLKYEDNSFDVVYSNMGIMFYKDILRGLKEIHRVMQQQGIALVNSWTEAFPLRIPLNAAYDTLDLERGPQGAMFSLKDPQHFETLCKEAGFSHIDIEQVTKEFECPLEIMMEIVKSSTQFSEMVKRKFGPQIDPILEKEWLSKIYARIETEYQPQNGQIQFVCTGNVVTLRK